ncbi:hypothetical protein LTR04_005225 [Oleoguttula sp. CCFEE 6159]|nr:hypothetical protein LTR04_005225 [Oleoguttula sp. CCFEE 6159]
MQPCLVMEQGAVNGPAAGWNKEIVHRDLKPGNILLDAPDNRNFPAYPTPKLADFGLGIETSNTDPDNPMDYNEDEGTEGFLAFEQRPFLDEQTGLRFDPAPQLLAHTNIWGIGMIMRCLVLLNNYPNQRNYETKDDRAPLVNMLHDYSPYLIRCIQSCLRFDPESRVKPRHLLQEIMDARMDHLRDGMRTTNPAGMPLENVVSYRADGTWPLGSHESTWPPLPLTDEDSDD